jgi:flavin-dependent dehydrogenase
VTPVGPDCVGVAVLGGDQRPFAARLRDFPALMERLPATAVDRPRGAGPLRQRVTSRVHGRALLVGDAAGYLDALTGEGLAISFRCARALVDRVCSDEPERYERDYRVITRRYQLITAAMLAAARRPSLRRMIVPAAQRLAPVFTSAVNALAR